MKTKAILALVIALGVAVAVSGLYIHIIEEDERRNEFTYANIEIGVYYADHDVWYSTATDEAPIDVRILNLPDNYKIYDDFRCTDEGWNFYTHHAEILLEDLCKAKDRGDKKCCLGKRGVTDDDLIEWFAENNIKDFEFCSSHNCIRRPIKDLKLSFIREGGYGNMGYFKAGTYEIDNVFPYHAIELFIEIPEERTPYTVEIKGVNNIVQCYGEDEDEPLDCGYHGSSFGGTPCLISGYDDRDSKDRYNRVIVAFNLRTPLLKDDFERALFNENVTLNFCMRDYPEVCVEKKIVFIEDGVIPYCSYGLWGVERPTKEYYIGLYNVSFPTLPLKEDRQKWVLHVFNVSIEEAGSDGIVIMQPINPPCTYHRGEVDYVWYEEGKYSDLDVDALEECVFWEAKNE